MNPFLLLLQVQLLVDFLTGNLGAAPQQQLAAKVVQLVIAGGSLGQLEALAAANPYSRQQTTDMEPVRWGLAMGVNCLA
jgi:DNA polymerase delta subunit 2